MRLTSRERELILSKDVGTLSTMSPNGWPHSIPVGYLYMRGRFYIPSSGHAKKVNNLRKNDVATLLIDDEMTENGVMIECTASILDGTRAEPFKEHMRRTKSWKNNATTVVINLKPLRKVSWL